MRYAIVKTELAVKMGFKPIAHRVSADGTQMVLNEQELRRVNKDIDIAARSLGGRAVRKDTALYRIRRWDDKVYTKDE